MVPCTPPEAPPPGALLGILLLLFIACKSCACKSAALTAAAGAGGTAGGAAAADNVCGKPLCMFVFPTTPAAAVGVDVVDVEASGVGWVFVLVRMEGSVDCRYGFSIGAAAADGDVRIAACVCESGAERHETSCIIMVYHHGV